MTNADWFFDDETRVWKLKTPTGEVLATMEHDAGSGHYKSGGVLLSANWNDAKAKCEALLAPKGKRK